MSEPPVVLGRLERDEDPAAVIRTLRDMLGSRTVILVRAGTLQLISEAGTETGQAPDGLLRSIAARLRGLEATHVLVLADRETARLCDISRLLAAIAAEPGADSISIAPHPLGVDERSAIGADPLVPGVERPLRTAVLLPVSVIQLIAASLADVGPGVSPGGPSDDPIEELLDALERPGLVHRALAVTVPGPRERAPSRGPLRVVVDVSCLRYPLSGTQLQTLCLIGALGDRPDVEVEALAPFELHPSCAEQVPSLCPGVRFVFTPSSSEISVVHRPFQVESFERLRQLATLGARTVITHQDMILERNPSYASSPDAWRLYARLSAATMSFADHVAFFSRHAALDAASEGHLDLERTSVVPLGLDHLRLPVGGAEPEAVPVIGDTPFLLVLGNAYAHKNRVWAIRLARHLVDTGWDGMLVLAGGHPIVGSSIDAERRLLAERPDRSGRVVDLGSVSEGEKAWLYRHATAVLFPSLYEGFGFVPFEAAAAGTPALYFHRSAMREFLPPQGAFPTFEIDRAASYVLSVIADRALQQTIVRSINDAAETLTWARAAELYADAYRKVLEQPSRTHFRDFVLGLPAKGLLGPLSREETLVIDVYRRHRLFGRGVDAVIASGIALRSRLRRSPIGSRQAP